MTSTIFRHKEDSELLDQLAAVEEGIGYPLWIADTSPASLLLEDLKASYPAKFNFYLRILRSLQTDPEERELLTPDEQVRLQLINNLEQFVRGECRFPDADISLHEYQQELFVEVANHLQSGSSKGWAKLPTGYGKSIIGGAFSVAGDLPSVIIVPRMPLVRDAIEAMQAIAPDRTITEYHGEKKDISGDTVVVLLPSLSNFNREARQAKRSFPIAFVDEAHLTLTGKKQTALDEIPGCIYQLAVSATTEYSPGKRVGKFFGDRIYEMTLPEAIELNILSGIRPAYLSIEVDLSNVRITSAGSYNEKDLEKAISIESLKKIASSTVMSEALYDQYGVIFVPSIAASEAIAESLRKKGIRAEAVHGSTPNVEDIQDRFEAGEIQVLITPQLLTIGWDSRRVDYALDLSPTASRVEKEQRIGRLARKSKFRDIKLYLELLPVDPRKKLVTASKILADKQILISDSTSSESRRASESLLDRLAYDINVEGVELVVAEREMENISSERAEHVSPLTEDLVRELLEGLNHYVLRDLQKGRTGYFLGNTLPEDKFHGTGRSLTRRYFSEIVGEPISRVDDDAVYRMIQTVLPEVGKFKFLDDGGGITTERFKKILNDSGITSYPILTALGRTGTMNAVFWLDDSKISGQFLIRAMNRSLSNGTSISPRWGELYENMVNAVFSEEERNVEPDVLLRARREVLRESFSDMTILLRSPDAISTYKVLDRDVAIGGGVQIKASRLIQNHLELLTGNPVKTVRTSQMLLFFADLFPELADGLTEEAKRADDRLTKINESNQVEITRDDLINWLATAGYKSREPFDTYGPTIFLAARYTDESGLRTGYRLVELYRRICGMQKGEISKDDLVSQMMNDIFGEKIETSPVSGIEPIRRFLIDAGVTPEWLVSRTTGVIMRTPITVHGITVTIERLMKTFRWIEDGQASLGTNATHVRTWICELFPECDELFFEQDRYFMGSKASSLIGNFELMTDSERQLTLSLSKRGLRAASFDVGHRLLEGKSIVDWLEMDLVRERQSKLHIGAVPLTLPHVHRNKGEREVVKYNEILTKLFPQSHPSLPSAIPFGGMFEYFSQLARKNLLSRDDLCRATYQELLTSSLKEGSVAMPLHTIVMELSRKRGYKQSRIEAVDSFIEELEPGILAERRTYWELALREGLAAQGIDTCAKLLKRGRMEFFRSSIDCRGRKIEGAQVAEQLLQRSVNHSDRTLVEIAQILFPHDFGEAILTEGCNQIEFIERLLELLSYHSIDKIKTLTVNERGSRGGDAEIVKWPIDQVREALAKSGVLPEGNIFTEQDLATLLDEVVSRTGVEAKRSLYERRRTLVNLKERGLLDRAIDSFAKSGRKPNSAEFSRSSFLIKNGEYWGRDILKALDIEDGKAFHRYLEARATKRRSIKEMRSKAPKVDAKEFEVEQDSFPPIDEGEDLVLFVDPNTELLAVSHRLVLDIIDNYLGESADDFRNGTYIIDGFTHTGSSLETKLRTMELLGAEEGVSIDALTRIVKTVRLKPELREKALVTLSSIAFLTSLEKREILKITHLAQKALPLGSGIETHRQLKRKTFLSSDGISRIDGAIFAHFIQSRYDVDVGAKDWQIKLLPKLVR